MGKSKKFSDFQKVKLRVGRRLPKGLNVTDTSFSTRRIILREQAKDEVATGPTTHRKLSLKDLLSRLDHYSSSTRHDSLVGLKELFVSNPGIIKSHLSSILKKSCQLIIDKDIVVRKAVLDVLSLVLKDTDSKRLAPFFPVLSSYVCCAMTHIVTDIRYDSLQFLDLLLDTFADLTVMSGNKIFQNFLDQISSERDPQSVKIGRALLVNPNEKVTSQRWRTNVLRRMEKFLRASLEHWEPISTQDMEDRVVFWDPESPKGVTLYFGKDGKPLLANKFSIHQWDVATEGVVQIKNPELLKNFISTLMPLLIETWVEASPSSMLSVNQGCDPSSTMDSVLQVTKLFGECAENVCKDGSLLDWFSQLFASDFQKHFMAWFPYAQNKSPPRKKRKHTAGYEEVSHVQLNLAVCGIFALLSPKESESSAYDRQRICRYLSQALTNGELSGVNDISSVVKIVRRLLKLKEDSEMLETLCWLCHHWQPGRKDRNVIMDFFVELVSDTKNYHLVKDSLSPWLRSLPKEIILTANSPNLLGPLLTKVKAFAVRGYPAFLQGLQENDTDMIALLSGAFEEEDIQNIVVLCSHLPKFSLSTFRTLAETLRSPGVSVRNASILFQTLSFRLSNKTDPGFEASEYLGFLLCVIIGIFKHEGNLLQQQYVSNIDWCYLRQFLPSASRFTLVPSDPIEFERHSLIIEKVLKMFIQFPDMNYLEKSVYTYLNVFLESMSHLPVHSAVAILRLASMIHTNCNSDDEDIGALLESLHVVLAMLSLAAFYTCSCMNIVGQEGQMVEDLHEAVLNFLQISECGLLVCELLYQQLQAQANISPEEAECVGGVLQQLLRSGVQDAKSMRIITIILRNLQTQVDMDGSEAWWKDLVYEFEMRYQRTPARHKRRH